VDGPTPAAAADFSAMYREVDVVESFFSTTFLLKFAVPDAAVFHVRRGA
jgi:hypothetical protein